MRKEITMGKNITTDTEKKQSKRQYVSPHSELISLTMGGVLLVASPGTGKAWNPNDPDDSDITPIVDEKDGNLGEEGSEITGAKQNQGWQFWD